ncbi:MAG TPA: hypothetical protein VG675_18270 [Bryobacteraceae bacterium]|nr:hypothetical protein [Bryobacteraceae bacterium]
MRTHYVFLLVLVAGAAARAADVCNPANVVGNYAFQLSGLTRISGTPKPAASLGSLTFDGHGALSGTASATFSGFLLGNPVTGTYEVKTDCSITWKLQDDSGAYQHFQGTVSPDGARVEFRQSDPGGARHGVMQKEPSSCSDTSLRERYSFTVSGNTTPMQAGEVARLVSARGTIDIAENGSFEVNEDCSVHFELTLPASNGQPELAMSMRGFLVNGGREILAFQTDPGAMVTAHLISVSQ